MSIKNPILLSISSWFQRTFAEPAAVNLFMTLLFGLIFLEYLGSLFMPVLVSIVIAYLLSSLVRLFERWHCPHILAVILAFLLFVGAVVYAFLGLLPLIITQLNHLINELPGAFNKSQLWLSDFLRHYPKIISEAQVQQIAGFIQDESIKLGQLVLKYSLSSISNLIQFVLYVILVPLLVFFFLKDAKPISNWFSQYLPGERTLVTSVWTEVNHKIGAYVRGRVLEIIIVGLASAIVFTILGLQYAVLLGVLVGISVIIPYIGAVLVTIPIVIVALMQWGVSAHFSYLIIAYAIIITLDANLLVPLLFSGAMNLHPIVIILSVIIFGGIWGFWGVFFAIPLATLVDVVLKAWPRIQPAVEKQALEG